MSLWGMPIEYLFLTSHGTVPVQVVSEGSGFSTPTSEVKALDDPQSLLNLDMVLQK